MHYDPRLLFAQICIHLDKTPAHSLEDLAGELRVDPGTIESVVTGMTGSKYSNFKDDILIAKLTRLFLARPNAPMKELSSDLGYRSSRAFAKNVRAACGASAAWLRKRIVAGIQAQKTASAAKAATTVH